MGSWCAYSKSREQNNPWPCLLGVLSKGRALGRGPRSCEYTLCACPGGDNMEESHPRGSDIPGAGAGEGRKQVEGLGAAAGKKGVVLRDKDPTHCWVGGLG